MSWAAAPGSASSTPAEGGDDVHNKDLTLTDLAANGASSAASLSTAVRAASAAAYEMTPKTKAGIAARELPPWLARYLEGQMLNHAMQLIQGHPLAVGAAVDLLAETGKQVCKQMKDQISLAFTAFLQHKEQFEQIIGCSVNDFGDLADNRIKIIIQEATAHVLQLAAGTVHQCICAISHLSMLLNYIFCLLLDNLSFLLPALYADLSFFFMH